MSIVATLLISAQAQAPEPALWLKPNGQITIQGKAIVPTFSPGTKAIKTSRGVVFDFDGRRSGILIPDERHLAITESFTVSTWINLRSYVNDGPGAQILFRGDDRGGLDPYTLVIHSDGTVNFSVQDAQNRGFHITAEVPLQKWTHVMANWDMSVGRLQMWINGENVAFATTTVHPFVTLDRGWAPGIGVGNVQNEKGPHNQPINGQLFDLRLMRGVWTPEDLMIRQPEIPPSS
jgi:Concanavalin A-like lectin/glucanases superfamily